MGIIIIALIFFTFTITLTYYVSTLNVDLFKQTNNPYCKDDNIELNVDGYELDLNDVKILIIKKTKELGILIKKQKDSPLEIDLNLFNEAIEIKNNYLEYLNKIYNSLKPKPIEPIKEKQYTLYDYIQIFKPKKRCNYYD